MTVGSGVPMRPGGSRREGRDRLARLSDLALAAAGAVVVAMLVLICASVILRYVFDSPLSWMEDIGMACLVAVIFLPLARVQREDGHVRVDFVVQRLPSPVRRPVRFLGTLLGTLYIGLLTYELGAATLSAWRSGDATFGFVAIPLAALYAVMAASVAIFLLESLRSLLVGSGGGAAGQGRG